MNTAHIVVLVTAKDAKEAKAIAHAVLNAQLAACVNIVGGVQSLFWWEGKVESGRETLLIIKTKKVLFQKLAAAVKSRHSYKNPEIIALPITSGSRDYLSWINTSLRKGHYD